MVFYYVLIQFGIWWLVHVTAILWKIQFPFHAHQHKSTHCIRWIHVICVVLGLLIPLIPVIVTVVDSIMDSNNSSSSTQFGTLGFGVTRFPPVLCTGVDRSATYYSLVLPLNLILLTGITELAIIFWIIHKVRTV